MPLVVVAESTSQLVIGKLVCRVGIMGLKDFLGRFSRISDHSTNHYTIDQVTLEEVF